MSHPSPTRTFPIRPLGLLALLALLLAASACGASPARQDRSATKAIGPGGGNDYYERGIARPDLVLAALLAILHPQLEPGHEFVFYRRVPRP